MNEASFILEQDKDNAISTGVTMKIFPFCTVLCGALLLLSCSPSSPQRKAAAPEKLAPPSEKVNWIDSTNYWHPATDALGSTIDTAGGLFKEGFASVGFTITPKKSEVWPFVELIFTLPAPLVGKSQLELTYRCDQELLVKLSQSDFGPAPEGNETWSHFQVVVPAAAEWSRLQLPFKTFGFPNWAPEKSRVIPMRLENIQGIYFTPVLDAIAGESSRLEIQTLEIL